MTKRIINLYPIDKINDDVKLASEIRNQLNKVVDLFNTADKENIDVNFNISKFEDKFELVTCTISKRL